MRRRKIYEVLDADFKKLFEGNATQCADFMNCDESHVRDSREQRLIMRTYRIRRTDRLEPIRRVKKPEPDIDYSTAPYECLRMHLMAYGNTFITFDPEPFIPILKSEGINCTYRTVEEFTPTNVSKRGRKPKPRYNYVVEVCSQNKSERSKTN